MRNKDEKYNQLHGLINTWRDPYDMGYSTTRAKQIQFEKGVTVLVGCNGSGKTTLLRNIRDACLKNNVASLEFDNLRDGGSHSMEALMFHGQVDMFASMFASSEGERISQNIGLFARTIGNRMHNNFKTAEEVWLLFDATDSGLSVDNVVELKEDLFQTILEDQPDKDIYIIISANEYELARGENCLDVMSGKYIKNGFKDYEDYRNFILESRKKKENRVEKAANRRKKK